MSTNLTARQQAFADLVLGGMPASRAYREAGYKAATNATAETCGSRLLSKPQLVAYIAERRAAAANRAELTYAGILTEFADFARDKTTEQAHRLAAYKFVTEHLARITPLATAVSEATGEATLERAARLTIGLLEAVMAGRLPIELGLQCIEAGRRATETIVHAEMTLEDVRLDPAPPPAPAPRDPTIPSRARPAWLRTTSVMAPDLEKEARTPRQAPATII